MRNISLHCFFYSLCCLDNSVFRHIFKHQITDLVLHNNDEYTMETIVETYTENVYVQIMVFFENLKHLAIVSSSVSKYPPLSLVNLLATINFSSILTELRINVLLFDDCLRLLDGRLKQLTTLIVEVHCMSAPIFASPNVVS